MKFLNVFLSKDSDCCSSKSCCDSYKNECCDAKKECCDAQNGCCNATNGGCIFRKLYSKLEKRAEVCSFARFILKALQFIKSSFNLAIKIMIFPLKLALAVFFIYLAVSLASKVVDKIFTKKIHYHVYDDSFAYNQQYSNCSISVTNTKDIKNNKIFVKGDCAKNIFEKIEKDSKNEKDCKIEKKFDSKNEKEDEFTIQGKCVSKLSNKIGHNGSYSSGFYVKMPNLEVSSN